MNHSLSQNELECLRDLWHVMQNYPIRGQENRFFEEPLAAIIGEDFDWDFAGVALLGLDVGQACNSDTTRRMIDIVASLCDPYAVTITALLRPAYSDDDEDRQRQQVSASFQWFCRGLQLATGRRESED